jgi:hypothetical protein
MNRILLSISLVILGLLLLLRWVGLFTFEIQTITGLSLTIFGLFNAHLSLVKENRKGLLLSSILFLVGIALVVKSVYELPDTRGLILVSILFISGAGFLILYFENSTQKVFLWSAILLFALSISSITLLRMAGLFRLTNKIADIFEVFWPVVLTLFGMSLFVNRKK